MPTLIGFPEVSTIQRVQKEWEPNPDSYIGGQYLPMNTTDYNESPTVISWDILAPAFGMIPPHTLDATPQMTKMPALKNKSMGTAYWRQKGRLNESDLLILRGFGPDYRRRAARDKVMRLQQALNGRLAVRVEWLRWQALMGNLVVNENGINFVIDYEIPAANKWTAAPLWTDTVNSDPVSDLLEVESKYEGYGCTAAAYVMNRNTMKLLVKNAKVRDLIKQSPVISRIGLNNVGSLITELAGVPGEIVNYNEGYFDAAGAYTKFIPNNKVVVIGRGIDANLGNLGEFASTPSLFNGGMDTPVGGSYTVIDDQSMAQQGVPYYEMTNGIHGLPVLFRPYWVQVITVG